MRFILLIAVVAVGAWWHFRSEPAASPSTTPAPAASKPGLVATPAPAAASWPKREINRAAAAVDAVKQQRSEF